LNNLVRINSNALKEVINYFCVLLISFISFLLFSPIYHPEFNSDQAIHVLMSARNDYPEGIYYWGQNRLGSFLPEVTSYFVSIFKIHPLTAISIVNHLFLLTIFFLLQIVLKNSIPKIFLAILLLFPLYTFNALLLIGHPYCSQIFVGTLAVFLLDKAYQKIIYEQSFKKISIWIYGLVSAFLFGISIWISESSFLFIVFVIFYFLLAKEKRKLFFNALIKEKIIALSFLVSFLAIGIFWILKIQQFKNYYPENDLYDQIFITQGEEISQQGKWMWEKFTDVLFFQGDNNSTSWFTWVCIICILTFTIFNRKNKNELSTSLLFTLLIGFVALFFSTWNFRSEFEPRYFTLLYPFLLLWIFIQLEKLDLKNSFLRFIPAGVLVTLVLVNNSHFITERKPGVIERFSEFSELEPGGVIGNYWQVYRACAISPFHLKGIPMQGDPLRNEHMLEEVMNEKLIYIIKTDFTGMENEMPDTLVQYGFTLVKREEKEREIGHVSFGLYKVISRP
jgi:hypothetical protein